MALPALTAFPHTLVRNTSRLGPRGVPLIPGGFGAVTASQSEQTHLQHRWVTVTAFGISSMSIICLNAVRTSEMPVLLHRPHLSCRWRIVSLDLRW